MSFNTVRATSLAVDRDTLGVGLYTPAEAAFYARVNTRTLSRWFFREGENVLHPQIPPDGEKTVTFLDFVQVLAVRSIRILHEVSLQRIRKAVDFAMDELNVSHPLAMDHRTYIVREGSAAGEVVIEIGGKLIVATGKYKRQHLIGPVAELYLDRIRFGESGFADEYTAWKDQNGDVRMNPHIRFGEPIVTGSGYSADALWEAVKTEGGIDAAARAYGVSPAHVKSACSYYDYLLNRDAA